MRRALLLGLAGLCAACGDDPSNPFANSSSSRPPPADAAILYVSGAWSDEPGATRELFAVAADGSNPQQLTTCGRASQPCDILQVAPGPDRNRVVAVRTTPDAEPGAQILYFMDLARSVESIVFDRRRVDSADWAQDGSFLLFASANAQNGNEDLFTSQPNGADEQNLTESLNVRERHARLDPLGRTAAFERIDEAGVSRVFVFRETAVTSGPATGPALPGTPYVVGSDADPSFSPDATQLVFRRLTGVGNGGLGTWDILVVAGATNAVPRTLVAGAVARGAPDWGRDGILFVETDSAANTASLVRIQPDGTGRTVLRTEPATARMGAPRWMR
jgi:Tol biopolymer transport system component